MFQFQMYGAPKHQKGSLSEGGEKIVGEKYKPTPLFDLLGTLVIVSVNLGLAYGLYKLVF